MAKTAKEFLNKARDLNRLIRSTQEAIDSLSPPHCGLGAQPHSRENTETDKQVRRYELSEALYNYMENLVDYNDALLTILKSTEFTPREKIIIQRRYMLAQSWKEIAICLDCGIENARKLDVRLRAKLEGKPTYWRFI